MKSRWCVIGVRVLLLGIWTLRSAYAGVELFSGGRSSCTIVVGEDDGISRIYSRQYSPITRALPSEVLWQSAHDLADHLDAIGGLADPAHRVRVVRDAAEVRTPHRILLGSAAIEAHDLQSEALAISYPGYVYRVIGNDLLIFGSSSKGSANGVYGFLQDELGVRWFGPQDLFRVLPAHEVLRLDARVSRHGEPSFPGRLMHVDGLTWGRRRMRMAEAQDDGEPFRNNSHNLHRIFPVARYFEEHPEFYALRGGVRRRPENVNFGICYSNPRVIEIAIAAALSFFDGGAYRHSFALGINDGMAYCECADCEALQPARTFRGQRVASDMYVHFVNTVARAVAAVYPDRFVGVIAYNDVTSPPLGAVEPNVHVVAVNDVSEYFDADYRGRDAALVSAWAAKDVTLGLYYYTQLAKLVPAYFPRLLSAELKERHAQGFTSLTSETGQGWPWHGPMTYVEMRLAWDVSLEVDALLSEYFEMLFGPASPHVQALYERFETAHRRPRRGGFLNEHYQFKQFNPYTTEDLTFFHDQLSRAHRALTGVGSRTSVDHDAERRLAYVSRGLRVFLEMLEGLTLARDLDAWEPSPDAMETQQTLDRLERIHALLEHHDRLYRETILLDPDMPGRFTGDTATPVRNQWKNRLSKNAGTVLAGLTKQLRAGEDGLDGRVLDRLNQAVADYTMDPFRKHIFNVRAGLAELGPNLASNPGFEAIWGEGEHAEIPPDRPGLAGSPHGWGVTPNIRDDGAIIDTVLHADPDERYGRRSARMANIPGRAYLLMGVPGIQTGQAYLCTIEAKLRLSDARTEFKPRIYMLVRWTGPRGWIREPSFLAELTETDAWHDLETVAIAPEGATRAGIFLFAENLTDGLEVWFDNLSVRQIQLHDTIASGDGDRE